MSCKIRRPKRVVRYGFSLMEMMIVLLLIAMMAGMVAFSMRGFLAAGRHDAAVADLAKIRSAIMLYQATYNRFPSNEEGLSVLVTPTPKYPYGFLESKEVPKDPWGFPYQYNFPGLNSPFEIVSFGADGEPGGEAENADLSSEAEVQ